MLVRNRKMSVVNQKKLLNPRKKLAQMNAISTFITAGAKGPSHDPRQKYYVDDLRRITVNVMNIWQTLEILAGNDIRRKYTPYEGYHDKNDILKYFKPAGAGILGRRDSFVAKTPRKPTGDDNALITAATANAPGPNTPRETLLSAKQKNRITLTSSKKLSVARGKAKRKLRKKEFFELSEADFPTDYGDIIKCNFSIPKIAGCLEHLMATNIIRLTDRKYMSKLRQRIKEDYVAKIFQRVEVRKVQEFERVRDLILDGKSKFIPPELQSHPVFSVNKTAHKTIKFRRGKLKSTRERNAERVERLGAKWERERLIFEQLELDKQKKLKTIKLQQKKLQQKYKSEDGKRGLNLLRIKNDNFRPSEKDLQLFLENERRKMKARFLAKPKPFIHDPKDMIFILRERAKARALQRQKEKEDAETLMLSKKKKGKDEIEDDKKSNVVSLKSYNTMKYAGYSSSSDEDQQKDQSDEDMGSVNSEPSELAIKDAKDKVNYLHVLESKNQRDVLKGFLVSDEHYALTHFMDPQVLKLKSSKTIRELYRLAEEIITGELFDVAEEEGPEEDDFP